jgi:hypothetical protein
VIESGDSRIDVTRHGQIDEKQRAIVLTCNGSIAPANLNRVAPPFFSVRLNSAFLHDAIALAEHDDAGLPVFDLMFGKVGEAHDGKDVTSFSLEGSRAVEDDLARTGIAGDGVGLEAISVCHIAAQDALVRYEPAFLHQVGGDGQAAFVLQIAICDCGAVNLRF